MTPEERFALISKELYMGQVPDIWNLLARVLIIRHLRAAEKHGYELGLKQGEACTYHWPKELHDAKKCECYQDALKRFEGMGPR